MADIRDRHVEVEIQLVKPVEVSIQAERASGSRPRGAYLIDPLNACLEFRAIVEKPAVVVQVLDIDLMSAAADFLQEDGGMAYRSSGIT